MTYLEQTALFLDLLSKHKKYCVENNLNWSVYPQYFLDNGITKQTLKLLEESHYIAIHENQPIWIAWTNPIFPEQTIDNLSMKTYSKLAEIRNKLTNQKKEVE